MMAGCGTAQKTMKAEGAAGSSGGPVTKSLVGTEWMLQELPGTPIPANSKASLAFPEEGRVAGNSGCNRFTGAAKINGMELKIGPLASTRMACLDEATNKLEADYLAALNKATRYEWKDANLLVYAEGYEKPLVFTRAVAAKP